jgi:hypothetical protein
MVKQLFAMFLFVDVLQLGSAAQALPEQEKRCSGDRAAV